MVDPLSVTSSIIAIVQLVGKLTSYFRDVKDAPTELRRYAQEAIAFHGVLNLLSFDIEQSGNSPAEPWREAVKALGQPNAELDRLKRLLEALVEKIPSEHDSASIKLRARLKWKFEKAEVAELCARMERVKTLVQVAMQRDSFKLSQAIKGDTEEIKVDTGAIKTDLWEIKYDAGELKIDTGKIKSDTEIIKNGASEIKGDIRKIESGTSDILNRTEELQESTALIEGNTGKVKEAVPHLMSGVGSLLNRQDSQKRLELLDWLAPDDYRKQQYNIISQIQDNTGEWFTETPEFRAWRDGSKGTLFCPGIPGAGKTMMAAIVVRHLCNVPASNDMMVAWFYCNYRMRHDQSAYNVLSALLRQFIERDTSVPDSLWGFLGNCKSKRSYPTNNELAEAFSLACTGVRKSFVVVDALDELDERERRKLIPLLRRIRSTSKIRLLVTSRPGYEQQFRDATCLEVRASEADIRKYVAGRIPDMCSFVQKDETLRNEIQESIVQVVDGMFLLARLYTDTLVGKRTKSKINATLVNLAKGKEGLQMAYGEALVRINGQRLDDAALAKNAICWISYAKRPLSPEELAHALAVDKDDRDLDKDNIPDINEVVSLCAGLVTIDHSNDEVRLVHYTTQEYLISERDRWHPTAKFDIAETCIAYISFDAHRRTDMTTTSSRKKVFHTYSLLEYVSRFLGWHLRPVQEEVAATFIKMLFDPVLAKFFWGCIDTDYRFPLLFDFSESQCIKMAHLAAYWGLDLILQRLPGFAFPLQISEYEEFQTVMFLAIRGGDLNTTEIVLQREEVNVTIRYEYYNDFLLQAIKEGRLEIAKMFLSRDKFRMKLLMSRDDVSLNAKDDIGHTALMFATRSGDLNMVKLLLERTDSGINMLFWCDWGYIFDNLLNVLFATYGNKVQITPLFMAVAAGREDIVQVLVENGADPLLGRSPLIAATFANRIKLAESMVDLGCNINATDLLGRTALFHAARAGNEETFMALLRKGARLSDRELGDQSRQGRTALSYASSSGSEMITKFLLENGCELESLDYLRRSPLFHAVQQGSLDIVRLLVGAGANVKLRDKRGCTLLHYTAGIDVRRKIDTMTKEGIGLKSRKYARRYDAIVHFLVETGVCVNSINTERQTPLDIAATSNRTSAARALLECGANLESRNRKRRTPLASAVKAGSFEMIELMLGNGAEVESTDKTGRTPLFLAVRSGKLKLVEQLLTRGACVNHVDKSGQTPLSLAARKSFDDIVELLLSRKADANLRDLESQSPLSWAARRTAMWAKRRTESKIDKTIRLLLENGAEPNAVDRRGLTPLWRAAWNGRFRLCKLLFKFGAALDSPNKAGQTLLSYAVGFRTDPQDVSGIHSAPLNLDLPLWLMDNGANVNSEDFRGKTPLSWAANVPNFEFLDRDSRNFKNFDVDKFNSDSVDDSDSDYDNDSDYDSDSEPENIYRRNQHRNLCGDRRVLLRLLLERGATVEHIDYNGNSPLHHAAACRGGGLDVLISAGAKKLAENAFGFTPLTLASEEAQTHRDTRNIEILLEHVDDADVNKQDVWDRTPLSYAAEFNLDIAVKSLLQQCARLDVGDFEGRTPLSYAAGFGAEESARLLLERGAAIDSRDNHGRTPLRHAVEKAEIGMVELLLEKGAVVDCKDNDGRSPVSIAAQQTDSRLVALFLDKGANLDS